MKLWTVYLIPAQMGLMALIVGTSSILMGVFSAPILQTIFVSYPTYKQQNKGQEFRLISNSIINIRMIKIVVLIFVFGIPLTWFWKLHWTTPFAVAGLFSVDTIRVFERNMLASGRRLREVTIITIGDILFRLVFVWFFLFIFHSSAYIAIIGNLAGAAAFIIVVKFTFTLESFSKGIELDKKFQSQVSVKILNLAKPLMPSMILANVTEMGNRYFIGATIGLEAAGLFVVSYGFVKRPYGMLNHVGEMTMTPIVKNSVLENNKLKSKRARWQWILFIGFFSLLGALLFYLLREPLVLTFLSDKYIEAVNLLFGIAIAVTFYNIANIFSFFSMTMDNSKAVLINNVVGSTTTMSLTVILCLRFGINGAVLALIAGYTLQLITSITTFYLCHKRNK